MPATSYNPAERDPQPSRRLDTINLGGGTVARVRLKPSADQHKAFDLKAVLSFNLALATKVATDARDNVRLLFAPLTMLDNVRLLFAPFATPRCL